MNRQPTGKEGLGKKKTGVRLVCWFVVTGMTMAALSGCTYHPRTIDAGVALNQANSDVARINAEQKLPQEPVTLYEAMARAVLYNRERRLTLMEAALAEKQADLSKFDMLPDLAANAGYYGRDKYSASSSVSVTSGEESLEPSYSSEKDQFTSDLTFTWNVLDFGLSYVRANQMADRHLIALEKERKAVHLLLRDVRKAWWEALSAQRLNGKLNALTRKVEKVLNESKQMENEQLQTPLNALSFQRSLMQILRALQSLKQELSGASYTLAALMGLPPGVNYSVKDPGAYPDTVTPDWQTATLEKTALALRTELMESRYENRIAGQEARAALLALLPHLELDAGWNSDSNTYLVNNKWWDWGARVGFNLFNVFKAPAAIQTAKTRESVAEQQRLALSMTVLMQVHLARLDSMLALRSYQLDDKYFAVQQRIMDQTLHTASVLEGETAIIREELELLLAEVRRGKSYADLQDSYGRLLVSVGIDPVQKMEPGVNVDQLARAIKGNIESWNQQKMAAMLDTIEKSAGRDKVIEPKKDGVEAVNKNSNKI